MGFTQRFEEQQLLESVRARDVLGAGFFKAGGSTTVRGFKQDQLTSSSGDAVFIFNQELRFPIRSIFSGAAFVDAGNVYSTPSDFNPFRLRSASGVGIRIQTAIVLIRLDLGFNLSPRIGEDRRRFSFGIGQAF